MANFSNITPANNPSKITSPNQSKAPLFDFSQYGMNRMPQKTQQPTPSTAIKSQSTGADGSTKTEYHAPAKAPAETSKPTVLNNTEQSAALAESQSQKYANPLIPRALAAQEEAKRLQNQAADIQNQYAYTSDTIRGKPIGLANQQGQLGLLERNRGRELQYATNLAQNAQSNAQNLSTFAGYGQPQQYSVGGGVTAPYNPLNDTFGGGGKEGFVDRRVQGSNLESVGNSAGQIQQINSGKDAANSNFDALIGYGQKFNLGNVPILSGLNQLSAGTFGGDAQKQQAIAGFQSSLANIQQQYKDLTGADPVSAGLTANVTPAALAQIKKDMQDKINNKVANLNSQISNVAGGTSNTNTTSKSSAEGNWPGWNPQ